MSFQTEGINSGPQKPLVCPPGIKKNEIIRLKYSWNINYISNCGIEVCRIPKNKDKCYQNISGKMCYWSGSVSIYYILKIYQLSALLYHFFIHERPSFKKIRIQNFSFILNINYSSPILLSTLSEEDSDTHIYDICRNST